MVFTDSVTKAELEWLNPFVDHDTATMEGMRTYIARLGWARLPSTGQPKPADDETVTNEILGLTHDIFDGSTIYTDGSCSRLFHPCLNRASWSVVKLDEGHTLEEALRGPVWKACLTQMQQARW